ncbi:MAG: hypothetical protein ACRDGF_10945, partial [Chloroflexota bacterium]
CHHATWVLAVATAKSRGEPVRPCATMRLYVGTAAFHAAGSSAISTTQGLQRRLRDLLTLGQQVQARGDHFQTVARSLLGFPTNSPFV